VRNTAAYQASRGSPAGGGGRRQAPEGVIQPPLVLQGEHLGQLWREFDAGNQAFTGLQRLPAPGEIARGGRQAVRLGYCQSGCRHGGLGQDGDGRHGDRRGASRKRCKRQKQHGNTRTAAGKQIDRHGKGGARRACSPLPGGATRGCDAPMLGHAGRSGKPSLEQASGVPRNRDPAWP
jgi:hypothetical protein